MVLVAAENVGGLFFQPMGKTKGDDTTKWGSPGLMGKATPSLGMLLMLRLTQ